MAFKQADFRYETSISTGTGDIVLAGAVAGYGTFASYLSDGDQSSITVRNGAEWETGIYTYVLATNKFQRTTVTDSSNGGALVNFSPGTKAVVCTSMFSQSAAGKQMIPVPAGSMKPNITNGAISGSIEMATNLEMLVTLDFDPTTAQSAMFAVPMPNVWDLGPVSFSPVWSHPATTTNFGVVFEMAAVALGDGDAIDAAFGTGQKSTDTGGTTNTLYIGPESASITVAGTPVAGDLVFFRIKRLPADAADTMAVVARLHAVRLFISTSRGHE